MAYTTWSVFILTFALGVSIESREDTVLSYPPPPPSIECTFFRRERVVFCGPADQKEMPKGPCNATKVEGGGPTPLGTYAIGVHTLHDGLDWHHMYPWSYKRHVYYDYNRTNPDTGRSYIAFNTGLHSRGSITVSQKCYRELLLPEIKKFPKTLITVQSRSGRREFLRLAETIGTMIVYPGFN